MRIKTMLVAGCVTGIAAVALFAMAPSVLARGGKGGTGGGTGNPDDPPPPTTGDVGGADAPPVGYNNNTSNSPAKTGETAELGNIDAGRDGEEQKHIVRDVLDAAGRDAFRDYRDQRNRATADPGRVADAEKR